MMIESLTNDAKEIFEGLLKDDAVLREISVFRDWISFEFDGGTVGPSTLSVYGSIRFSGHGRQFIISPPSDEFAGDIPKTLWHCEDERLVSVNTSDTAFILTCENTTLTCERPDPDCNALVTTNDGKRSVHLWKGKNNVY